MATVKILPAKLSYKIMRGDDFADQVAFTGGTANHSVWTVLVPPKRY